MSVPYGMLPQTKESISHILTHYELYKNNRIKRGLPRQPMIVGVSGCQGSGKTTLCDTITHLLKEEPYNLNIINFSLDDLYLNHKDQLLLSKKYENNPLYQQRGQAGSHDLKLAKETFNLLIQQKEGYIPIPAYDKSLNSGKGDRLDKSQWKYAIAPIDIILFEGWMLGFKPLLKVKQTAIGIENAKVMNALLNEYERDIYPFFDIFIHLSPNEINQVFKWRLEQEQNMKITRGVEGLSDEQVKLFVETYMPAYELYLPRLNKVGFYGQGLEGETLKPYEGLIRADNGYSEKNRHLRIILDEHRRVLQSETIRETIVNNTTVTKAPLMSKSMLYKCAFIGVLGVLGYKRKSVMNSFLNMYKKLNCNK